MIRRAFAFSVLQRYSELAIQVGAMIVLARLIAPDEFGIFVAGAAVLALVAAVGEFGQRDYLIQERELTPERRAAALGLGLAASITCALAVAGSVLFLPESVVDDQLRPVVLVLSMVLLTRPFTIAATALLQREMRFGPVCAIGVLEAGTSAIVAISLAALGFGAMGLAWGALAGALVGLARALAVAGRAGRTLPCLRGWRVVFRFGVMRTAIATLARMGDAGGMLVVTHLLGFGAAGLLDRGRRIGGLFGQVVVNAVRPVLLPLLAARERSGGDVKEVYLFKVTCVSGLAWPFFAFVALFAEPIVYVLLGPMWMSVVPIVQILCVTGIWVPTNSLNERFYIALGMLPVLLRRQLVLKPIALALIATAALVSLELVAAAFVMASLLKAFLDLVPLKRRLNYGIEEMLRRALMNTAVAAASLTPALCLLAAFGMPTREDLALLLGGAVAASFGWLGGLFAVRHPLSDEIQSAFRAARSWFRLAGSAASRPGA